MVDDEKPEDDSTFDDQTSMRDQVPAEVQQRLKDLGNFIRDQRNTAQLSLRRLSSLAGISNPYLSQIERGLRKPSAEILQGIAKGLRISSETLYIRAGILHPQERQGVMDSIRNEEALSEDERDLLLEMYAKLKTGKVTVEEMRKSLGEE
jgi:transcriptional regulator with XRE-family HTH domain